MTVHLILVLWIFTVVYTRDFVWPSRLRVARYAELADLAAVMLVAFTVTTRGFRRELWRVILTATNRAAMAAPAPGRRSRA